MSAPTLVWFRDDLRLADQPALRAAVARKAPVIPIFILDEESEGLRPLGAASRWWLHHSLAALSAELDAKGAPLLIFRGPARAIIADVVKTIRPGAVMWNRRYRKAEILIDAAIKEDLKAAKIEAESFSGTLLFEPWTVKSKAGTPMRVFTPFFRAATAMGEIAPPTQAPRTIPGHSVKPKSVGAIRLEALDLLPTQPDWAGGLKQEWVPGEKGARKRLDVFLKKGLADYKEGRNFPDRPSTSKLSPHLRFGEITARQCWHAAGHAVESGESDARDSDLATFRSELGWREFSYHLLFNLDDITRDNMQKRFDAFQWARNEKALRQWQKGQTGYPIVDAGMRELWQTGWMHNRVRMIVGSFLVKHLMIDWRRGEDWFWDTLVDADMASNPASWQWVAGTGADAAPYFRVFNPVLQGQKFDPDGAYVRHYVPELARMPAKFIHAPWTAPDSVLQDAGVSLGFDYPHPMVDHQAARDRALATFEALKGAV